MAKLEVSKRNVGIGIDFGTSNSVAAIYDGETLQLVALGPAGAIIPSATYIDRTFATSVGQEAIDRYILANTGRTVELIPEVIGESFEFSGATGGDNVDPVDTVGTKIYGAAVVDSGLEGRLFRGIKRLLGDSRVHRLMVFEQPFRLVALITPLLLHIRKKIQESLPAVNYGHLGHPVNFEGRDEHRNKVGISRLADAFKFAGIDDQTFYPEPIAAAASYLVENPDVEGDLVLSFDFGGGTLDLCILRRTVTSFEVVSTHGVAIGGDHIDQKIFRSLLFPLLGEGARWRRRGMDKEIDTLFPFGDYADLLLNWPISYTLNQNRYTAPITDFIKQGGEEVEKLERLRDLIQQNLSYVVFQEIKEFKARLSYSDRAALDIPEIDVKVSLTRPEFEDLILDFLDKIQEAIDHTLSQSNLDIKDIDLVLRTGGSSLIPAIKKILEDRFPGRVVEHDPFTSVAAGLAISNYKSVLS